MGGRGGGGGGRPLRARSEFKGRGRVLLGVPAKVSPAGGGVSAQRDSHSSEVWQLVSGYSCRSAMIALHLTFHSPHLLQSTQESDKLSITDRTNTQTYTDTHSNTGTKQPQQISSQTLNQRLTENIRLRLPHWLRPFLPITPSFSLFSPQHKLCINRGEKAAQL